MNSAYSSSCLLTDSSTRAWTVTAFGCFGGELRIDKRLVLSCSYKMSDILSDKVLVSRMQPRKTSVRSACEGGSDSTKLLGGSAAKKWGRSRPICSFLRGDFRGGSGHKSLRTSSVGRASGEERGEDEAEEGNSCLLHLCPR